MARPLRVLVHQIGSLGDTIVSIPALRLVRRRYGPSAQITLLSQVSRAELVKAREVVQGSGLVDDYIEYQMGGSRADLLKMVAGLWWKLVRRRFDTVVYLMESERSVQSVQRDILFFKLCGIRTRLGFEAFSRDFLYPRDANGRPRQVPHEARRRAERLSKYGFDLVTESDLNDPFLTVPDSDRAAAQAWLDRHRRHPERRLAAICPASKMTSKLWPTDRWAEIGKRLVGLGEYELVVIGGPGDRAMGDGLIAAWGDGINAAGEFSIMGSAALLHQCAFVVSVDSGPMHLAAVGGVPCVAVFSSIDFPGRFSPLGRNHILLRHGDLPCAACRKETCPVPGHPCMTGIEVEDVWQAVQKVAGGVKIG